MTIRAATPEDLPAVAAIYTHYVLGGVATFEEIPPSPQDWRRRLDDLAGRALPFLVADLDGTVAGYAYAGPFRPKPAYRHTVEDSIYLAPGHTGRGLGRALLGPLLSASAEAGARQMVAVIADTGDNGSLALHEAFGFAQAGVLKAVGYKHGRWLDTVLMQRALTPPPEHPAEDLVDQANATAPAAELFDAAHLAAEPPAERLVAQLAPGEPGQLRELLTRFADPADGEA